MTLSKNDPTLLFFRGQHLDEYVNEQRKKCCKHMDITLNSMLDSKVLFSLPQQNQNPKSTINFVAKAKSKTTRKHRV